MDLQKFFNPESIAIVGVSHDKKKVGYLVASNMIEQGFEGKLFFVNPKGGKILRREVYEDIKQIKEQIDLVVLAIPAVPALKYLDTLKKLNITNVVLFAAGFKENGGEGLDREKELIDKCTEYGITLLGPNCIGYINTATGINSTFLKHISPTGNIGFVSQSGALGSVLVDELVARHNLGLSYFISMGNKSVLDESDILDFLAHDDRTHVIAMYIEGVNDGEKFKQTLTRVTKIKPVIILKSGTTEAGSKAAMSHTGGLAGDDTIFSAVFKQCGAIRARDYIEFTTLLELFSFDRVPMSDSVLVLSNAGGAGVLLADELVEENLSLVTVSTHTKNQLTKVFGDSKKITVHNPIDLLGDASAFDYEKAIAETIQEREIGSVVILLTPQANTEIWDTAKIIIKAQQGFDKPIYPVFMGKDSVQVAHDLFEKCRVASFRYFDYLVHAIGKAVRYKQYLTSHAGHVETYPDLLIDEKNKKTIGKIISGAKDKEFLNLFDSLTVLEKIGVPVSPLYRVYTEQELRIAAKEHGFPLTMKIASDDVTHKTEVRGVVPNIPTLSQLVKEYQSMTRNPAAKTRGVFVQPQAHGYEVFIGAKRDATFGVVLIFGLGGIYAELFKDVATRVYPFSQREFIRMAKETKMFKLLSGFRGSPPIDLGLLYDVMYRICYLMVEFPMIKELDVNPLFVSANGVSVVDARIIL